MTPGRRRLLFVEVPEATGLRVVVDDALEVYDHDEAVFVYG